MGWDSLAVPHYVGQSSGFRDGMMQVVGTLWARLEGSVGLSLHPDPRTPASLPAGRCIPRMGRPPPLYGVVISYLTKSVFPKPARTGGEE